MFHVKCCGRNIEGQVCVAEVYMLSCIMVLSSIMPKVAVEGLFFVYTAGKDAICNSERVQRKKDGAHS